MKLAKKVEPETTVPTVSAGDDRVASLFQPDVLLGDQYLENFRRKVALEPEKALLLAVLDDGVRCFQDHIFAENKKKQMLFEEAEEWLFSDDASWIFSFVSICAVMGLDPDYLRRGLRQWEERAVSARRKKQRGSLAGPERLVA